MSINRVSLSGNLTRDPELRSTQSGTGILSFGLAVNDRRKNNQTGEWEDYPNFVDCIMFGARAESLAKFLSKGTKVAIDGKLHYSQWEDRNGGKRSKVEVVVDDIEFMSRREQPTSDGSYQPQQYQPPRREPQNAYGSETYVQPRAQAQPSYAQSMYDSDIPF